MQKITPFLWFDTQAEEAARFYVSVFKNAEILQITRYGAAGPGPKGGVMTVHFRINGQDFTALNAGPAFKFNEAISFAVPCDTQAELDEIWSKLTADGGREVQCGWLKDKYGVSWQIVPAILPQLLDPADQAQCDRVMAAVMKMVKLDIAGMKRAAGI